MQMNRIQLNALAKMWITDPDGAPSLLAFRRRCAPLPYGIGRKENGQTYWIAWKKIDWCIEPSGLMH
jgi:hypothetical protein